ncbi:hypothetical protein V6N11_035672 [Hibiscus sabdariffa]|uniref:Endonuclease/exonuclease/phosphatase domain-containing protein n=1 Tax=Hibiscus sabdariffa TaxID=183260 RepID=A0ABR1ZNR1_9ROSI
MARHRPSVIDLQNFNLRFLQFLEFGAKSFSGVRGVASKIDGSRDSFGNGSFNLLKVLISKAGEGAPFRRIFWPLNLGSVAATSYLKNNVRGLGNKDTVRALKNAVFKYRDDIIFLSETKQKKRYIKKIHMKLKIDNVFYVELDGISGGLALWWSNDVKLFIVHYDKNFVDTKISINREIEWFVTFIYAPSYTKDKQRFWETLASLRNDVNAK